MTFDPGRVRLSLRVDDGIVRSATLACERPNVSALLRGKVADQAVTLIPLIYALCGKAQGIAARAALAAARGQPVVVRVDPEAWTEAAREHAWKLLVDWPRQLGLVPDETFFVRLLKSRPEQRVDLTAALAAHSLAERLLAACGDGVGAELLAGRVATRRRELVEWLAGCAGNLGRMGAQCLAREIGESTVETARGTLIHRLTLEGERIADYAIEAPTDRHFSTGGDAATWVENLRGLRVEDAERQSRLLLLAFDPCVPWECVAE